MVYYVVFVDLTDIYLLLHKKLFWCGPDNVVVIIYNIIVIIAN